MSKNTNNAEQVMDFMKWRKVALGFSAIMLVVSIFSLATNGLKFGLDFTGGLQVDVTYSEPANLALIREQLETNGIENAVVVIFGADTDVKISMQEEPFKFSVGAVTALIHDVIIVLGLFSILQLDFDPTVLAALLAVVGYSLNDTIVVSDRIRENFRKVRKGTSLDVINQSLTQTFGRTLVTSFTTLLVLLALFFVGGDLIHAFSIALIVGVVIGTYSSIYVAANILLLLHITKEDLIVPEKEGAEFDDGMP